MSRRPVHLAPRHKGLGTRDAVWQAIRRLRRFTARDIRGELYGATSLNVINNYLNGLALAGYLKKHERPGRQDDHRWELLKDIGVERPRVNNQGEYSTYGAVREQIWRSIKILKDFSVTDLGAVIEGFNRRSAHEYLKYLRLAGYLVWLPAQRRYRIVASKCRGAQAPQIQNCKQVYDPNLGKVVWPAERAS